MLALEEEGDAGGEAAKGGWCDGWGGVPSAGLSAGEDGV